MHSTFTIRPCKDAEEAGPYFRDYPVLEGWNHSVDYEEVKQVYFHVDPQGLLLGTVRDEQDKEVVVAMIFACKHTADLAYLGCYIVPEEHRGKGYGAALFKAALEYTKDCKYLGLDAMYAMTDSYVRSGFTASQVGLTYRGDIQKTVVEPLSAYFATSRGAEAIAGIDIQPMAASHVDDMIALDFAFSGMERQTMWQQWIQLHTTKDSANMGRAGFVARDAEKGKITHFATVRPAVRGFVVALYGTNSQIIRRLLLQLGQWLLTQAKTPGWRLPADHLPVFNVNTTAHNPMAIALCESLGFTNVSGRVRMWRGSPPTGDPSGLFSIASFTIG
ncbi:acyl-CoA N-acyltransferase [Gongronella butleri]|nr:acyl-CoA N-acyltransferase [Gongronella butleri]